MSEQTGIQWTNYSWSPWFGCAKVDDGCRNCYAEKDNGRYKRNGTGGWGVGAPRVKSKGWDKPRAWERAAAKDGRRLSVFPSLCDPWDEEVPEEWRVELFDLIGHTPHLDWLLLTKRPQNVGTRWLPLPNVWIGTSVSEQTSAEKRIPALLKISAAVRFLSVEPLLGPVDLTTIRHRNDPNLPMYPDWVIVGGESGPGARPCNVEWIRSVVAQCKAAGVPCFVKQLGAKPVVTDDTLWHDGAQVGARVNGHYPLKLKHHKGGNPREWSKDLRVREFPTGATR